MSKHSLVTNLWFNNEAEQAAQFYTSIFKDGKIGNTTRYGKAGHEIHHMPEGTVMTIEFSMLGLQFVGLNGGPVFRFSEAISFIITCDTQEEIDYYWQKLGEGGDPKAQQCGWLKDRYGLSWQVVPSQLNEMMKDKDAARVARVTNVMLSMKRLEIEPLERAFRNDEKVESSKR